MEREKTGIRLRHLEKTSHNNARQQSPSSCRKRIFTSNSKNSYEQLINNDQNIRSVHQQNILVEQNKSKFIDHKVQYEMLMGNLKQKTFQLERNFLELNQKDALIETLKHKIQALQTQNQQYKIKVEQLEKKMKNQRQILEFNTFNTKIQHQKQTLEMNKKIQGRISSPTFNQPLRRIITNQSSVYESNKAYPQTNQLNFSFKQLDVHKKPFQSFNKSYQKEAFDNQQFKQNSKSEFKSQRYQNNQQIQNSDIVSPLMALNSDRNAKKSPFIKKRSIQDQNRYNFRDLQMPKFEQIQKNFHF